MEPTNDEIRLRWENYRRANLDFPIARKNEIPELLSRVTRLYGVMWEVGAGSGILTIPLAQKQRAHSLWGGLCTSDVVPENLAAVREQCEELGLYVDAVQCPMDDPLRLTGMANCMLDGGFARVVTIATLHHFDDRSRGTGESGRTKALETFYRALGKGGELIIADVMHGTIAQRYFDAVDDPTHCYPVGHPHDFFTVERLTEILLAIGFKDVSIEIKFVPWQFASEEDAKLFVHTLHNARCSPEESFAVACEYLGWHKVADHYELGWELGYIDAVK